MKKNRTILYLMDDVFSFLSVFPESRVPVMEPQLDMRVCSSRADKDVSDSI